MLYFPVSIRNTCEQFVNSACCVCILAEPEAPVLLVMLVMAYSYYTVIIQLLADPDNKPVKCSMMPVSILLNTKV